MKNGCHWPLLLLPLVFGACAHTKPQPTTPRTLHDIPAEALFARAQELAESGEYVPAEQFLQAARTRGYPEEQVVKELVKVCLAGSRFDSALGHAVPFLERNPEAWELRQVVATIYIAMGQSREARDELDELMQQRPEEAAPHYLMAVVMRDEFRDEDQAAAHFGQYLGLAPTGSHAPEVRAWMRRHTRQRELPQEVLR